MAPKAVDPVGATPAAQHAAEATRISDAVEISSVARLAAKIHELPAVRADLVARVKGEIKTGTYETPERIELAVDRLMEELFPD